MRGWTLTLMVTIGVTGSTQSGTAGALKPQTRLQQPSLTLDLRNTAEVSTAVLADAKKVLTQIYNAAGIDVQWTTAGADFTVIVIFRPPPAVRVSSFALGYTPSNKGQRSRQAFVLADRIRNRSSELGISFHLILGMTMAHEVAHLLLPFNSHSRDGIMRKEWTQSDYQKARLGWLLFTDEQALVMRDELSADKCDGSR